MNTNNTLNTPITIDSAAARLLAITFAGMARGTFDGDVFALKEAGAVVVVTTNLHEEMPGLRDVEEQLLRARAARAGLREAAFAAYPDDEPQAGYCHVFVFEAAPDDDYRTTAVSVNDDLANDLGSAFTKIKKDALKLYRATVDAPAEAKGAA